MKQVRKVARVAAWDGWCSPCEREDRPLVLTRSGPSGLLAWVAGHGDEDRCLLLTCRVCGSWQVVPPREEDDPEVVLLDEDAFEDVAALLREGLADVQVETVAVHTELHTELLTELLAEPVVVPVPAARSYAEVAQLSAELSHLSSEVAPASVPVLEAAPVPEPAAAPVRRLVLAPPAAPAVSAQTLAATAHVLSTARAAAQAAAEQRAAASRPRRVDVPRPRAVPQPPAPVAATSIALPSTTVVHSLVLARAS